VPVGNVYALLAEHRRDVFPDGLFAKVIACERGGPLVRRRWIASVRVLHLGTRVRGQRGTGGKPTEPTAQSHRWAPVVGEMVVWRFVVVRRQRMPSPIAHPTRATGTGRWASAG
jgi:hypothetical protein